MSNIDYTEYATIPINLNMALTYIDYSDLDKRIEAFNELKLQVDSLNQCTLDINNYNLLRRIGKGATGEVYLLADKKYNKRVVLKVSEFKKERLFKKSDRTWNEVYALILTNKFLLQKISPNFTFFYGFTFCNECKYSLEQTRGLPKKINIGITLKSPHPATDCLKLYAEFANGDLKRLFQNLKEMQINNYDDIVATLLFQICAALVVLQNNGFLIHGDFHPGNILYNEFDKETEIKYWFDNYFYFVKTKFLVKLWDFDDMSSENPNILEGAQSYQKKSEKEKHDIQVLLKKLIDEKQINENSAIFNSIKEFQTSNYAPSTIIKKLLSKNIMAISSPAFDIQRALPKKMLETPEFAPKKGLVGGGSSYFLKYKKYKTKYLNAKKLK